VSGSNPIPFDEIDVDDFDFPEDVAHEPQPSPPGELARFKDTMTADGLRIAPHSVESEEGLLAICLMEECGRDYLADCQALGITPEYFFKTQHKVIYETLEAIAAGGSELHEIILLETLRKKGLEDEVGGIATIYAIQDRADTPAHGKYYAQVVREKYLARVTLRKSREVNERIQNGEDPTEVIEELRIFTEELRGIAQQDPGAQMRSAVDFQTIADDDHSVLLGQGRYICRGGICATVSSSGMGKSSLTIQEAFCYAIGRPFMGIKPNGRLRSLIIQSEDDDGDIGEVVQSVLYAMEVTEEERQLIAENVQIVTDKISRGDKFILALNGYTRSFKPDLVWINPLHAFFKGDISSADDIGNFLREGLARANRKDEWAYMLVHHTTKPSKEMKREIKWNEAMYDMAGSAEIINAVRAIRILQATNREGEFVLNLAKRGKRAGVLTEMETEDGESTGMHYKITTRIPLKHSDRKFRPEGFDRDIPLIFWEPRDHNPDDDPEAPNKGGRTRIDIPAEDIYRAIPDDVNRRQSIGQMFRTFGDTSTSATSVATFRRRLKEMQDAPDNTRIQQHKDGRFWLLPENTKGDS